MAEGCDIPYKPGTTTQGVMFLTIGQGLLVAFGYVVHLVGARVLTAADYGRFMTALSVANWLHVALGTLILPGICKIISENHGRLRVALRTAAWWHWGAAAAASGALFIGGASLARLMGDGNLKPLFLVTAVEVLFFAGFTLGRYLLAALRHYGGALATLAAYSVFRALGAVVLLLLGFGAVGATAGLAAGSVAGAVLGMAMVLALQRRFAGEPYEPMVRRSMLWAAMTLPAGMGVVTLTSMDMWFVKSLVADPAVAGLYGAAFAASRLPDVLAQGLLGAVFPRVSNALANGRPDVARSVAAQAMRFILVVFTPVCAVTACSSRGILEFLFGAKYGEAHILLTLLVLALSLASVLKLMLNLLAAADRPGPRLAFVLMLLPAAIGLNFWLIPKFGAQGAAMSSVATMAAGALIGGILAYRFIGALPSGSTAIRCLLSAGAVYALGTAWPAHGVAVIAKLAVLSAAYLGLLVLLREVTVHDIRSVRKNILARTAKPAARAELGGDP